MPSTIAEGRDNAKTIKNDRRTIPAVILSSNQQNRFRISFMISPPLRIISTLIFLEMSKTNPKTKGRMVILFFIHIEA